MFMDDISDLQCHEEADAEEEEEEERGKHCICIVEGLFLTSHAESRASVAA